MHGLNFVTRQEEEEFFETCDKTPRMGDCKYFVARKISEITHQYQNGKTIVSQWLNDKFEGRLRDYKILFYMIT
jgi:hypothetical protein